MVRSMPSEPPPAPQAASTRVVGAQDTKPERICPLLYAHHRTLHALFARGLRVLACHRTSDPPFGSSSATHTTHTTTTTNTTSAALSQGKDGKESHSEEVGTSTANSNARPVSRDASGTPQSQEQQKEGEEEDTDSSSSSSSSSMTSGTSVYSSSSTSNTSSSYAYDVSSTPVAHGSYQNDTVCPLCSVAGKPLGQTTTHRMASCDEAITTTTSSPRRNTGVNEPGKTVHSLPKGQLRIHRALCEVAATTNITSTSISAVDVSMLGTRHAVATTLLSDTVAAPATRRHRGSSRRKMNNNNKKKRKSSRSVSILQQQQKMMGRCHPTTAALSLTTTTTTSGATTNDFVQRCTHLERWLQYSLLPRCSAVQQSALRCLLHSGEYVRYMVGLGLVEGTQGMRCVLGLPPLQHYPTNLITTTTTITISGVIPSRKGSDKGRRAALPVSFCVVPSLCAVLAESESIAVTTTTTTTTTTTSAVSALRCYAPSLMSPGTSGKAESDTGTLCTSNNSNAGEAMRGPASCPASVVPVYTLQEWLSHLQPQTRLALVHNNNNTKDIHINATVRKRLAPLLTPPVHIFCYQRAQPLRDQYKAHSGVDPRSPITRENTTTTTTSITECACPCDIYLILSSPSSLITTTSTSSNLSVWGAVRATCRDRSCTLQRHGAHTGSPVTDNKNNTSSSRVGHHAKSNAKEKKVEEVTMKSNETRVPHCVNGDNNEGGREGGMDVERQRVPSQDGELFYIARSVPDYLRLGALFGWVYGWQLCFSSYGPPRSSLPWLRVVNAAAVDAVATLHKGSNSS